MLLHSRIRSFLAAIAVAAAACATAARADEETFTLGLTTFVKPSEMVTTVSPMTRIWAQEAGKVLGKRFAIKLQVSADYETAVDAVVQGKVDFSRLGPVSLIQATKRSPEIRILAVESRRGSTVDHGVICVKSDSATTGLEQLKGKSFAFGDKLSTAGRYLPQSLLLTSGIRAKDLSRFEYLGRFDAVGKAVGSGRFDAGAVIEGTFRKLTESGEPLREIARYESAPHAWIAAAHVHPIKAAAFKVALLNLDDPSVSEGLKAFEVEQFVEPEEASFRLVEQAIERNEDFFR